MEGTEPNEIVHVWNSESELIKELTHPMEAAHVKPALQSIKRLLTIDGEGISLDVSFRDGNGNPLTFPIRMVSKTRFRSLSDPSPPTD